MNAVRFWFQSSKMWRFVVKFRRFVLFHLFIAFLSSCFSVLCFTGQQCTFVVCKYGRERERGRGREGGEGGRGEGGREGEGGRGARERERERESEWERENVCEHAFCNTPQFNKHETTEAPHSLVNGLAVTSHRKHHLWTAIKHDEISLYHTDNQS